jgi:hypothetical protein
MEYRSALQIGPARVGITTSHPDHIPQFPGKIEVKSLLTDFLRVENIAYSEGLDGHIHIEESEGPPRCSHAEGRITVSGPIRELASRASDARFSLWGNQGLLYRYVLYLLEARHRIFSFHACALYSPGDRTLFVVAGGGGSGKTVYLLSGLSRGLRLFSTETVHLELKGEEPVWRMGSLVDNIRLGTLKYDFPEFLPDIPLPPPDRLWQEKTAVDLSGFRWKDETIQGLSGILLLFPRIEMGRRDFVLDRITDRERAAKRLFDNASEKLAESFVLYDTIAVPGFDNTAAAQHRLDAMRLFVKDQNIRMIASVLSDPEHCWGDILQQFTQQGVKT